MKRIISEFALHQIFRIGTQQDDQSDICFAIC